MHVAVISVLIGLSWLGTVCHVILIGRPKEPFTPLSSAVSVIISIIYTALLILLLK